jgi:hypothetical protein
VNTVQKVAVIIAGTGLLTTLVLPGRQTPQVITALFGGLGNWTRKAQGFA